MDVEEKMRERESSGRTPVVRKRLLSGSYSYLILSSSLLPILSFLPVYALS